MPCNARRMRAGSRLRSVSMRVDRSALCIGMVVGLLGGCAKEQAPSAGAPAAGEAAAAPSDGMAMYAGQLYGCLQQVFVPPASAAAGLSAHLKFNVGAAGEVAGEQIAQSS